jgi:hypothetical protein
MVSPQVLEHWTNDPEIFFLCLCPILRVLQRQIREGCVSLMRIVKASEESSGSLCNCVNQSFVGISSLELKPSQLNDAGIVRPEERNN